MKTKKGTTQRQNDGYAAKNCMFKKSQQGDMARQGKARQDKVASNRRKYKMNVGLDVSEHMQREGKKNLEAKAEGKKDG